ncbi:hypothetical protein vseg_021529 [Gypsophila vaccaria]
MTSTDPQNAEKVEQLKKELQTLSTQIIQDNHTNDGFKIINQAIKALNELKDLSFKLKKPLNSENFDDDFEVPLEFICPISKEIMNDPVILSSGQTYDRPFIEKWLNDVHRTCPQTREVLSHAVLTPNHLVRELIEQWCKDHGIEFPTPAKDPIEVVVPKSDRDQLIELLDRLSLTLSDQKEAAKEIRLLTKSRSSGRSLFVESADAIPKLLSPLLPSENLDTHPDLQADLVSVLFNVSIPEGNKQIICEHPLVLPLLVESLTRGTIETRSNAAGALFSLSSLDSNKVLIGDAHALTPLVNFLQEEGHPVAMKDAAAAIFSLCRLSENRRRAISGGAIKIMLSKIRDGVLVGELLSILALLAAHEAAATEELVDLGAVNSLLSIIRESSCERNKENCIVIVYSICKKNEAVVKEVVDEEKTHHTISKLSDTGTKRAKGKADRLLDKFFETSETS